MPNFELEPVILSLGCCLMRHKFSLPKAIDWFKTPKTPNKHALGLLAGSFITLEPVIWLALETLQALPTNDKAAGCIDRTQEQSLFVARLRTLTVAKQDAKLASM